MKKITLVLSLVCFVFGLNAQIFSDDSSAPEESNVISVLNVSGKAKYKATAKSRYKKVRPGDVLVKSGSLKLKKKSQLSLLSQGKSVNLSGKGKHALSDLKVEEAAEADEFMNFLSAASGFAGPGGKSRKDTSSVGSGHGQGNRILGTQPSAGKVVAKPTTFKWTDNGAEKYTLKIYKGSEAMFSKEVTTNELKVNLAEVEGMNTNEAYLWQVETSDDGGITRKSPGVEFSLATVEDSDKLLRELRDMEAYKKSNMWQKRLREVHALRSKGFQTEAKAIYMMVAKQFPKNQLVKGAAAMF